MTHKKDFSLNFKRVGITASCVILAIIFAGCADGNGGGSGPGTGPGPGTTDAVEIRVEVGVPQNLSLLDNGISTIRITIGASQLSTIDGLESGDTITVPIEIGGDASSRVKIQIDSGNFETVPVNGASITLSNGAVSKTITLQVSTDTDTLDDSFTVRIGTPTPAEKLAVAADYTIQVTGASGTTLPENNELTITVLDAEGPANIIDTDEDGIVDVLDQCSGAGFATEWTSKAGTDTDRDGCRDSDEDVDDDNDGLIEITTLAQLNSIRYNEAGTSYKSAADAAADIKGAPVAATADCDTAVGGVYLCGYELMNDLSFDTGGTITGKTFNLTRSKTTIMTIEIDVDDEYYNGGEGWIPICTNVVAGTYTAECAVFTGIFDGNNHTISDLYIKTGAVRMAEVGLFGAVSGEIRNVRLTNYYVYNNIVFPLIEDRISHTGGLVGRGQGATIVNSHGENGFVRDKPNNLLGRAGGLAGTIGSITRSRFTGSVVGGLFVGGLAGVVTMSIAESSVTGGINEAVLGINAGGLVGRSDGAIRENYATIDVDGSDIDGSDTPDVVEKQGTGSLGGLVGLQETGTITTSYATGTVSGKNVWALHVGGLVGLQKTGTITASYATGAVNGSDYEETFADSEEYLGGLVGDQGSVSRIVGSYATGNVTGKKGIDHVGGLVGHQQVSSASFIIASYATGNVDGGAGTNDAVGGLVGRQGGEITASYATGNVDGGDDNSDRAGGLVGFQSGGVIAASYATGDVDGGDGDTDSIGTLIGRTAGSSPGSVNVSYGFGEESGGEGFSSALRTPPLPAGVTTATALSTTNTNWNTTNGGLNAWDFGDSTQTPALRFADYDGTGGRNNVDYCGTIIPMEFADGTAITCGNNGSLIPGQAGR